MFGERVIATEETKAAAKMELERAAQELQAELVAFGVPVDIIGTAFDVDCAAAEEKMAARFALVRTCTGSLDRVIEEKKRENSAVFDKLLAFFKTHEVAEGIEADLSAIIDRVNSGEGAKLSAEFLRREGVENDEEWDAVGAEITGIFIDLDYALDKANVVMNGKIAAFNTKREALWNQE